MKILIIQQRYGIGDMVIFLPYIHAISKKFNTPVSLLAKESSRAKEIFNSDERINKIITLKKDNDGFSGFLKLCNELRVHNKQPQRKKKLKKLFDRIPPQLFQLTYKQKQKEQLPK